MSFHLVVPRTMLSLALISLHIMMDKILFDFTYNKTEVINNFKIKEQEILFQCILKRYKTPILPTKKLRNLSTILIFFMQS